MSHELLEKIALAQKQGAISPSAAANITRWLTEAPFASDRPRLIAEIEAANWRALDDAFYAVLEFGTGGRRGRLYPVGTNVLNDRTMGESARGLADYILKTTPKGEPLSCVIAHDTRHNSAHFARRCACVMAAAGFRVYLCPQPRATPLLSFAVRYLKCSCGIMITASHNPPSDNGFKCYNRHGAQVIPPDDAGIIQCVQDASSRDIPEENFESALAAGSISYVTPDLDQAYIQSVVRQSVSPERQVRIVYTPMHGVGESSCAAALLAAGFNELDILDAQRTPDGDFPNVPGHVSNPEIPRTLQASIDRAKNIGADLVLASDPDADRIGMAVPRSGDPLGDWTTLDGNQIGILLASFVLEQLKSHGQLKPDHYIVTTLVSTQMARALAQHHGIRIEDDLLVGFKWIAQRIDACGPDRFVFGFEESHGYLRGTDVRDKDASVACLLAAELAAHLLARGKTVLEYLDELYLALGHYGERLINKVMEGRAGAENIQKLMRAFRNSPPTSIAGLPVTEVRDYAAHQIRRPGQNPIPLPEPSGDLLIFHLAEPGTRFAARPSGTEPKIKFYIFARTDTSEISSITQLPQIKDRTRARLDQIAHDLELYVNQAVQA
jgi:phosphoglucomutase/phosphomannomutase